MAGILSSMCRESSFTVLSAKTLPIILMSMKEKLTLNFDYAKISDEQAELERADTVKEKGFFILPSELFVNVRALAKDDPNLNETLARVFHNIENSARGTDSEDNFKGLFDDLDVLCCF